MWQLVNSVVILQSPIRNEFTGAPHVSIKIRATCGLNYAFNIGFSLNALSIILPKNAVGFFEGLCGEITTGFCFTNSFLRLLGQ